MTNINILPHHYITNEIDSTIKSCLNCDDPHLHFTAKPCEDTFKQTKYLIFSAIIDFLPAEISSDAIIVVFLPSIAMVSLLLTLLKCLLSIQTIKLSFLLVPLEFVVAIVTLLVLLKLVLSPLAAKSLISLKLKLLQD